MILLSDNDIKGAMKALRGILERDWADEVKRLDLRFLNLEDLGLAVDAHDDVIYRKCLEVGAILVTGDKTTKDGPGSLELVIARHCRDDSFPVLTIASRVRILFDGEYARDCAFDMLDCLSRIEQLRGTRRIFLPFSLTGDRR